MGAQKTAFDQLVSEFNETVGMERGIYVEAASQGGVSQLIENIIAASERKVGAQPIPNIFAAYADTAHQVDQLGPLADLDPYFTQKELDTYMPAYIEEGRLDGVSLKILPTAKSTEILMINSVDWQKFAQAAGASLDSLSTIEELVQTAGAYYDWTDGLTPNIAGDGRAFFGRDAMANYLIIAAASSARKFSPWRTACVPFKPIRPFFASCGTAITSPISTDISAPMADSARMTPKSAKSSRW